MPKKFLVTGGAGFIGSNLVEELVKRGHEVLVIDNLSTGKKESLNPAAQFHKVDIRDLEKIKPLFKGAEYVFHLAALPQVQPSIIDPITAHDINLTGTLNVLKAALDAKVKKVIYSSSSSVYGHQKKMPVREDMPVSPISPYALQKHLSELYCQLFNKIYGLSTVCLRYFNVYGPRQATQGAYALVIAIFLRQRLKNKPMTIIGDGGQRRDFINVSDVVAANILAAQNHKVGKGEVINIGCGRDYSVNDVARFIGGPLIHLPPRIEPRRSLADISLAKKILNWEPKEDFSTWLRQYKKEMGL